MILSSTLSLSPEKMIIELALVRSQSVLQSLVVPSACKSPSTSFSAICSASSSTSRRTLSLSVISTSINALIFSISPPFASPSPPSKFSVSDFFELQNSGGVKALDLLVGSGEVPAKGDQVAVHYYGRLAAKQGWRFDSTYDHKDESGEPNPFVFVLGSGKVIPGIEAAVRSMKVGGIRRVIIPPSQGYQNTSQEPIPPNERSCMPCAKFPMEFQCNGNSSSLVLVKREIKGHQLRWQVINTAQTLLEKVASTLK